MYKGMTLQRCKEKGGMHVILAPVTTDAVP